MKLFKVPAGTRCYVIARADWDGQHMSNAKNFTTRKENTFELEDLVCDPTGDRHNIRGSCWEVYAHTGFYGFQSAPGTKDYILLVHGRNVEIL